MIRECRRIALWAAVLSCCAPAQTISEPYKQWLACDVSWLFSEAEVGQDFFLKMSFHGAPVVGTRISLISALSKDGRVVAKTRTNSHGVAHFKGIPPGTYDPDSPDGTLFPSGDVLIEVKAGHTAVEMVELDWPNQPVAYRFLRGRFTISEQADDSEIQLQNALVELRDVYTARLIESASTDANGDYQFSTSDPGVYALRLVLPEKARGGFENRDLAVELDPSAEEVSIPEMKVVRSDCNGIQLLRRSSTANRWEAQ